MILPGNLNYMDDVFLEHGGVPLSGLPKSKSYPFPTRSYWFWPPSPFLLLCGQPGGAERSWWTLATKHEEPCVLQSLINMMECDLVLVSTCFYLATHMGGPTCRSFTVSRTLIRTRPVDMSVDHSLLMSLCGFVISYPHVHELLAHCPRLGFSENCQPKALIAETVQNSDNPMFYQICAATKLKLAN